MVREPRSERIEAAEPESSAVKVEADEGGTTLTETGAFGRVHRVAGWFASRVTGFAWREACGVAEVVVSHKKALGFVAPGREGC